MKPHEPNQSSDQIREQIARSVGAKATIYYRALDGVTLLANHLTVQGPAEQHGYIPPGGGWSLYYRNGDKPSYRFPARRIRRKKKVWVRLDNVVGFKFGW